MPCQRVAASPARGSVSRTSSPIPTDEGVGQRDPMAGLDRQHLVDAVGVRGRRRSGRAGSRRMACATARRGRREPPPLCAAGSWTTRVATIRRASRVLVPREELALAIDEHRVEVGGQPGRGLSPRVARAPRATRRLPVPLDRDEFARDLAGVADRRCPPVSPCRVRMARARPARRGLGLRRPHRQAGSPIPGRSPGGRRGDVERAVTPGSPGRPRRRRAKVRPWAESAYDHCGGEGTGAARVPGAIGALVKASRVGNDTSEHARMADTIVTNLRVRPHPTVAPDHRARRYAARRRRIPGMASASPRRT